jgi:hypothetical protein
VNPSSFLLASIIIKNIKIYRITKFHTNIKYKLNVRWIKYVDIKNYVIIRWVGKFEVSNYTIPSKQ